jgi:hypothetical protein
MMAYFAEQISKTKKNLRGIRSLSQEASVDAEPSFSPNSDRLKVEEEVQGSTLLPLTVSKFRREVQ